MELFLSNRVLLVVFHTPPLITSGACSVVFPHFLSYSRSWNQYRFLNTIQTLARRGRPMCWMYGAHSSNNDLYRPFLKNNKLCVSCPTTRYSFRYMTSCVALCYDSGPCSRLGPMSLQVTESGGGRCDSHAFSIWHGTSLHKHISSCSKRMVICAKIAFYQHIRFARRGVTEINNNNNNKM